MKQCMESSGPMVRANTFLLLFALLFASVSSGYPAVLTGRVVSKATGRPLAGANVQVLGTHHGTVADLDGRFSLTLDRIGTVRVQASHVGYAPGVETVELYSKSAEIDLLFELGEAEVESEEVVYTATRTWQLLKDVPVQTELVTSEEIERRASFNAAEALESEIGLQVQEDFSGQGITMQGVDPDKVLILVDGNRMIGRVNGSIDLEQITTSGVKQIEVVKGAVSTLYGSEAIGGVINIITRKPVEPFRATIDLNGGGWIPGGHFEGERTAGFAAGNFSPQASVEVARGRFGLRGSVGYTHNGEMDLNPATGHTEGKEAVDRLNADARIHYDLGRTATLRVDSYVMNEEKSWVEDAGLQSLDLSFDDGEINRRFDLSASIECTPKWAEQYSIKVYRSQNDHRWEKKTQSTGRVLDYSEGDEVYHEASAQLTKPFGAHKFTIGADAYLWDIETESQLGDVTSSEDASLTAYDAYLQDEWRLPYGFGLTLLPGLRFEQHEVYGSNWSPRLSTMWQPTDQIKVRASAGMGYRAPSSKELYFVFNHASAGYIVEGNENLEPETSRNISLGVEHTYEDKSISRISVFYNDLRNLIDFDSIGATEEFYLGVYRYENITSAWTRGIEVERGFRFLQHYRIQLAYTFMETRNTETGTQLLRRAKHSGRWEFSYDRRPWHLRIWGRYRGPALYTTIWGTDDIRSSEYTTPYQLWNIALTHSFSDRLSTYFKISNLMDATHVRYGPRTGRIVTVGMRYRWAPAFGTK
ncbi:TonB-dependent receptor [bacterium]|nr:TonB-dependent receptor [bacterium]